MDFTGLFDWIFLEGSQNRDQKEESGCSFLWWAGKHDVHALQWHKQWYPFSQPCENVHIQPMWARCCDYWFRFGAGLRVCYASQSFWTSRSTRVGPSCAPQRPLPLKKNLWKLICTLVPATALSCFSCSKVPSMGGRNGSHSRSVHHRADAGVWGSFPWSLSVRLTWSRSGAFAYVCCLRCYGCVWWESMW